MTAWSEERVVCGGAQGSPLRWEGGLPFRVLVGTACVLSMFGAALILVSYVFFRSLRNRARLVLVHISLMDLGTVLSKFVGNAVDFDRYYVSYNGSCTVYSAPRLDYVRACETQAFLLHFFTLGSVLWTTSLSVYLYFLLVHHRTSYARRSHQLSYFLCYGLALLVNLWLLLSGKLGYGGNGYCGMVAVDPLTGRPNQYAAVLGYDLWVYFTMTFVPVLYLAVHLYLRDVVGLPQCLAAAVVSRGPLIATAVEAEQTLPQRRGGEVQGGTDDPRLQVLPHPPHVCPPAHVDLHVLPLRSVRPIEGCAPFNQDHRLLSLSKSYKPKLCTVDV